MRGRTIGRNLKIRAADAKEVAQGLGAEETFRHPNQSRLLLCSPCTLFTEGLGHSQVRPQSRIRSALGKVGLNAAPQVSKFRNRKGWAQSILVRKLQHQRLRSPSSGILPSQNGHCLREFT